MEIHFLPILVCVIISIVLGSLWYGAMFGKAWMRLNKINPEDMKDPIKKKAMQKNMLGSYILQFALSFLQIWVLAHFIASGITISGLVTSLWIYAGFILPMAAGGSMWNTDSRKDSVQKFLIVAGYNLVLFIILGLVLGHWM